MVLNWYNKTPRRYAYGMIRYRANMPATLIACTLLLPISNEHVTALRFDLIWLASYYMTTPNPNPDAGIVLLSYRPVLLLPYESNKPYTDTPTNRQALYRYCTQTDKTLCCYAYDLISLVLLCLRTLLIRPCADIPTS
jgi:hypothetical protein